MEKRQGSIAAEDREEAQRRLQEIGCHILRASRDELYLGMRFMDVALSSFMYCMDSGVSPFGTDGNTIYFHPSQLGGLYRQNRRVPAYGAALYFSSYDKAGDGW